MRKLTRSILATTAAVGLLAVPVAGAGADDQVITGTVGNAITIDSGPADATLTLPATVQAIGQIQITANAGYELQVQADKDRMTQWDATNGYSTDANKTLDTALNLTATISSGTGVGASADATTTSATLAVNALSGLLSETDVYDIAATQLTTALDPAGSYRIVVTYTAAEPLS